MATVQQPTTQLEFHQAMADFKTMFPSMDDDVIEVSNEFYCRTYARPLHWLGLQWLVCVFHATGHFIGSCDLKCQGCTRYAPRICCGTWWSGCNSLLTSSWRLGNAVICKAHIFREPPGQWTRSRYVLPLTNGEVHRVITAWFLPTIVR